MLRPYKTNGRKHDIKYLISYWEIRMKTKLIVKVTPDGKLEIPSEVLAQLQPLTEYEILVTEGSIIFKKIIKPRIDLDKFLQEIDELEPDPEQPTLQEISEIVKEVRQELWGKK